MSRTQELFEREKARILGEAREELERLKRSADTTVQEAVQKLDNVLVLLEEADKRMGALGVSSVTDILLDGGFIYVDRVCSNAPNVDCARDVFDWVGRSAASVRASKNAPLRTFHPDPKREYEIFLLITPVGKKS